MHVIPASLNLNAPYVQQVQTTHENEDHQQGNQFDKQQPSFQPN
jgi:hypothetical protein